MENIPFIIGIGKIFLNLKMIKNGLAFVLTENIGDQKNNKSDKIEDLVLKEYQPEWSNYEAIIGEPISIGGTKLMKVLKYGKTALLRNPKAIFLKMLERSDGNLICSMAKKT